MIPKIGGGEIILIIVVILLLFGARKLPELARSLGSSAREFRKGIDEGRAADQDDEDSPSATVSDSNTTTSGTET